MRHPGHGIAGFEAWTPGLDGANGWVADPGLLSGSDGFAPALLAATTVIEPSWDQIILVDIPPAHAPWPNETE